MPLVSYHKGRAKGSSVTSSNLRIKKKAKETFLGVKSKGMYPCLNCTQCPFVYKGKQFVHPLTGLCRYGITTCETTQMVKSRISQHRSAINLGNTVLPVSKHLEKGHTSDQLKFMVLESVPPPLKRGLNRYYDLFLFL
ncbi:hypothetical protein XELAEV_18013085mg [Xenopus laevis]|uniref:Uncharacterized protein n=1 Tax=Xenopus laevis TaxID=8355 RepID=A0A974DPX4_XENLA|nr:hypothetical protein XELAEV_18013085mg [Xenopus laevis]